MIIKDLLVHSIKIPLKTPFIISAGAQRVYDGVILELKTEDGTTGWGEAAPSSRVTGETAQSVITALDETVKPMVIGKDIEDIDDILDSVETALPTQPSACCALDIALHDLKAKAANIPVKDLFGNYRKEIPISFTVVIGSVEESIKSAEKYIELGAKVLKVKLGVDPDEDVDRIRALRQAFGDEIKITGDANEGYSVDQAIDTLNQIHRYNIEFVEQPVPAYDIMGLKDVRDAVEVPIMADEAAQSLEDVKNILQHEAADMINIKLMKCGGLRNAAKIAYLTENAGIPCQLGCMIETGVAITAGTHIAIALENMKYADLDGHTFLIQDIVMNHQITRDGLNTISGRPGLGIDVKLPN